MELQKIRDYLMDTFYNMCVDDGHGHDIQLEDAWMEERFVEAGLIEASASTGKKQYPKPVHEHMVLSHTEALNLDSVAASYSATLRKDDPLLNNFTRSTVDSLYVVRNKNKQSTVWFIEFKNGEWETEDVYRKITDSIFLLNDLEKLDQNAILTNNRTKEKFEVHDLELSKFYKEYTDFDGTLDFYKSHAVFVLVSGKDGNCFRNFEKLCKKRADYAGMNYILEIISFDVLKKASEDKYHFGFEYINKLAFLILNANSTNEYISHYKNILYFFERLKAIKCHDKTNKDIIGLLGEYPRFIPFLKELLYQNYSEYEKLINLFQQLGYSEAECFMCVAAVCSVQPAKGRELTDDYQILCDIGKVIVKPQREAYKESIIRWKEKARTYRFDIEKEVLEEISGENFSDIVSLLVQEKFEDALKRTLFILRIREAHSMGKFENMDDAIRKLMSKIYGNDLILKYTTSQQLEQMMQQESDIIIMLAATISFMQEDMELRKNSCNRFVHMVRQLEYLKSLALRTGDKRFGEFASPLGDWLEQNKKNGKKLDDLLDRIEQKIIDGNSIQEIFPMYYIKKKTIGYDQQKLRNLAARAKGKILNDVQGVKAMDFKW